MRRLDLRRLCLVGCVVVFSLAGCSTVPPAPVLPMAEHAPAVFSLNGRIAVRFRDQSSSGTVRWHHTPTTDAVALLSPLGQTVTEVNRDANGVTLIDSAHKSHQAANAEALTEDMLGWPLPLSGLSYWVTGQAQPGTAFQVDRDADRRPKLLTQNGWQINYTGWQDVAGQSLPHKLSLQREGLQIRLVADEWVLPAP